VAFIYKGASAVAAPVSPLVRAPFDRQRDTLKLARMGNADCKRLWNDFVTEAPAQGWSWPMSSRSASTTLRRRRRSTRG
jgi:hypothetical protein